MKLLPEHLTNRVDGSHSFMKSFFGLIVHWKIILSYLEPTRDSTWNFLYKLWWCFTFVVEQKTFILSRSGKLIFAEIAPHFAENIDSFSAHPIRLTFDGDGSNFLLIHLITPTFGFRSGLSHKILQPSAPQIVVTPKDNISFKRLAFV